MYSKHYISPYHKAQDEIKLGECYTHGCKSNVET